MRAIGLGLSLAATVLGCGSAGTTIGSGSGNGSRGAPGGDGGTGSGGNVADGGTVVPVRHALKIRVTGSGDVQGGANDCRTTCQQQFEDGQTAHLVAVPDAKFYFDGWQGDCSGTGACDLGMTADRSVTASFSLAPPAPVQIHVSLTGEGQGKVTSSPPGVDCPNGPCDLTVPAGTIVILTGHPGSNATLSGWGGLCEADPCRFVASADATVYARFAVARYTLTVSVNGPGRVQSSPAGIDCPGRCSAAFEAHSLVMVHATPDAGNYFHDWGTACGDGYGPDCGAFMHGDYSMTATFSRTERLFKLVVYQSGYGSGRVQSDPPGLDCSTASATCSASFAWGTSVALSATAMPGSTFPGWGYYCPGTGPCSIKVISDRFAVVTFDAPPPVGGPYTVRELPAVEQVQDLVPYAINSGGDIAGSVTIPHTGDQRTAHAFFYDATAGTSTRIGDDGTYDQAATGINDARQVSIITMGSDGERVYRWEAGALTLVVGTQYYMAGSSGIDAKGNVYGVNMVYPNPFHAYVWDGTLHDLSANVGVSTDVMPPDLTGRLYGTMKMGDGYHLIEYVGTGFRDYGVPFSGFTGGRIGGGVMVGATDPLFMALTAYVYDLPNGPFRVPLGIRAAQFSAANAKGDVVGALHDGASGPRHAILLQQDGLTDLTASLNDPSWDLVAATAINEQGQIAGYGYKDGHRAAFLLTPGH